ncbi:MAG: sulfatase-like hydrolase/transferase, partial [Deltaproteobacteria bacterium]|nr:sulfatase-like hydrolase/transferase [Deltaproteobacteria bacterium]
RPDALGWAGGKGPTPAFDALAASGFRFPAAVSPAPLTLPVHTSLMTGLLPRRHGIRDNGRVLRGGIPTLAERLAASGWSTGAVVSGYPLKALFGLARGFGEYDDVLLAGKTKIGERIAPETTAVALRFLRQHASTSPRKPFFLWVHYFDPHDPYEPPARLVRPGPRGAYDGEVALVDESLAELRKGLATLGLGPTMTVLTADHGESLGEHGEATHGFFVYDSTVLVPLVFDFPGRIRSGENRAPARIVDVVPTVLDFLGLPAIPGDGVSLRPTLEGRRQVIPPAYVETQLPWLAYGWAPLAALRTADRKVIAAPRPEYFDLRRDAAEQRNLWETRSNEARPFLAQLRKAESVPPAASAGAGGDSAAHLRSLGYLSAGSSKGEAPPGSLADPKDRLAEKALLEEAEGHYLNQDYRAAHLAFQSALKLEPRNPFALLRMGQVLTRFSRFSQAVKPLQEAVRFDPTNAEARFALADALSQSGDRDRAIEAWRAVLVLQPDRAAAWSNLGAMLGEVGETDEALDAAIRALELEPTNWTYRLNTGDLRFRLALIAATARKEDEARRQLGEALRVVPDLRKKAAADPRLAPLLPAELPKP